jgi:NADH-quinone oxidoreductase subunit M
MQFLGLGILTWITFLPVIGMVVTLLLPKDNKGAIRWTAVLFTALQLVLAGVIYFSFNRGMAGINTEAGFQFVEKASWIDIKAVSWFGRIHIDYFLGIDGLSVLMVILTALISFIAVFASFGIQKSLKGYLDRKSVV